MAKLRIIVGQGTAAEVYRFTKSADDHENLIIGARGLWASLPGNKKMGQPAHLLALPGQKPPPYKFATGLNPQGLNNFLDVNTYQQGLVELSQSNDGRQKMHVANNEVTAPTCKVKSIGRYPKDRDKLLVRTENPRLQLVADQVIIATGIGPQRKPESNIIEGTRTPADILGYEQMLEGTDYINSKGPPGLAVAIYGGGATAAWVAAEAMNHANKVLWIARPGGTGFTGGVLPGNRNVQILQNTKGLRIIGTVENINFYPRSHISPPIVFLTVTTTEGPKQYFVNQFVYSLGGDPAGEGSISKMLGQNLLNELSPLMDVDRVISNGDGTLAWATPKRELIVIGSATYNLVNSQSKKQDAPMATLPHGAQVPDGIAMIVSSVSALNNFIPIKQDGQGKALGHQLNINTADRNQLAVFLTIYHPEFPPHLVESVVAQIIHERSRKPKGWDPKKLPSSPTGKDIQVQAADDDPAKGREWGLTEAAFNGLIEKAKTLIPALGNGS